MGIKQRNLRSKRVWKHKMSSQEVYFCALCTNKNPRLIEIFNQPRAFEPAGRWLISFHLLRARNAINSSLFAPMEKCHRARTSRNEFAHFSCARANDDAAPLYHQSTPSSSYIPFSSLYVCMMRMYAFWVLLCFCWHEHQLIPVTHPALLLWELESECMLDIIHNKYFSYLHSRAPRD
jgi:hypothetical protein